MKTRLSIFILGLLMASNCLSAQTRATETIYFESNEFELTEESKSSLNSICNKLNEAWSELRIIGHTDADGSQEYNDILSKQRANAVVDYLQKRGVNPHKIKTESFGEHSPIAHNVEREKHKNRRVEIQWQKREIRLEDVCSKLKRPAQFFELNASDSFEVVGDQGTRIKFSKGALVDSEGAIFEGKVQIELEEFYEKSDMIAGDLMTMSNGRILESGGMIFVSARGEGKELSLKEGAPIEIDFASAEQMRDVQTFLGEEIQGQINWVEDKKYDIYSPQKIRISIRNYDRIDRVYIGDGYFRNDTIRNPRPFMQANLFSSSLGWINCDRFYKYRNKMNLIVKIDTAYEAKVRLVFRNINSIMPATQWNEGFRFTGIPIGSKATLIAMSMIDDVPYYASKEVVIGDVKIESLELSKTSLAAIKDDLMDLN